MKNFQKCIEYGQKVLDCKIKKPIDETPNLQALHHMSKSAKELEKSEDAIKYLKEIVKLYVVG